MTFLTQTDVDPNTIISVLRQGHSHFTNESDKKILETILKNFERTVYPNRNLFDYTYIDLRIEDKVVVKEKYRKV